MAQRFTLKRYIKVLNGKIIDTTLLMPHVECYYVEEEKDCNKLYVEDIYGNACYLGKIVAETNEMSELEKTITSDAK